MNREEVLNMIDGGHLAHYGIKGQKWNVRRFQNEDGSLTEEGKRRYGNSVFISGTTKTSEDGEYKREKLPDDISSKIDDYMRSKKTILVGDAPGIDSQVQDYLAGKGYKNVEVFVSGNEIRKNSGKNLNWTVNNIDGENYEKYSKEWRAVKDKAMNSVASEGLAIVIPNGSCATRNNIARFIEAGKSVLVYQLGDEKFIDNKKTSHAESVDDFLAHYGIKGQKWGDRRFQNEDGSLTPEGRRRYGLKSDYSNMSDKELQEAISTKRTQNQYVDLMTEGPRKKKQEISNFIKTASSTAKSANDLADKTVYESYRSGFKEEQNYWKSRNDEIKDELKDARKAKDEAKIESLEAEQAQNKEKIDYYKDAQKSTDAFKGAIDTVSGLPAQYSEGIGKMATKDELEERTAVAYRNINEMDKDQLKKTVDRMLLEKQYDELVNPPQPSRWERGREVLQTIGAILGIAGAAATLVLTLKKIKGSSAAQSDEDGEYLAHYGVKGMKKGDRRYQNEDGSLTPEGYRHYGIDPNYKRGISDQKDVLARKRNQQQRNLVDQRNRQQLNARNTAYQEKQRAYTQKLARRQAIRDAKNQAAIDSIYRRQAARDERYNRYLENKSKAENRKNIRQNVVKGVAAVAAIGAALYVGRHFLKEKALNAAHVRDIETINIKQANAVELIKAKTEQIKATDVELVKENHRFESEQLGKIGLTNTTNNVEQTINNKKTIGFTAGEYKTQEPVVEKKSTEKHEEEKKNPIGFAPSEKSKQKYTSPTVENPSKQGELKKELSEKDKIRQEAIRRSEEEREIEENRRLNEAWRVETNSKKFEEYQTFGREAIKDGAYEETWEKLLKERDEEEAKKLEEEQKSKMEGIMKAMGRHRFREKPSNGFNPDLAKSNSSNPFIPWWIKKKK